ncbi:MAG TPA: SDR family oxidoreductase [Sphingobacteriaceae bacterium]
MEVNKLDGKVALVTGADSGIGQAIAIAFASEGAHVIICYHSDESGASETAAAVEAHGRTGMVLQVDVRDEQAVGSLFETGIRRFGAIDILVNNAGVSGGDAGVADMTAEQFDRTIRTNLYGPFFFCSHFVRHRRQQGGMGKIVNISSVHEEIMMPGYADYNASKAGLRNLMRTLALEVAGEGINVNNICPGMILTPMNQQAIDDPGFRAERAAHIPMKRPGRPEEIARLAVFLASADADYVTGSSYFMDGGLTLNTGQGA